MLGRKTLPLFLLCSILSAQALSQVYTWVDENGQKHFGSQPPASERHAEPVNINHGYVGDGRAAAPALPARGAGADAAPAKVSKREMCKSAMRWTAIDIENLKEMALERKEAGRITAAEYAEGQKNFAGIEERISMQNCVTSSGEDQQRYECLSRGAGVMVCSGLAAAAMEEGMEEARKKMNKR
ncbi:hypothetical protein M2262_003688 [Pseudomonas sp. BIGb0408]|uniref:DUF4124 domain-containing protein n=1 Tax=Phytopseudomonas flavescens TaxID=29435 RepID=A0A7Y9XKS9_9GAMM|nr:MULTISPECIES: DUF4124 domain-containing protein [Pseudomonas]MCW2293638.1 hypothetical protein [Pseudomonas sp. BIGb0408]NYH71792.1 hypothetical protein [Pseudomonas flavescens]